MPLATHTEQVPATTTNLADLLGPRICPSTFSGTKCWSRNKCTVPHSPVAVHTDCLSLSSNHILEILLNENGSLVHSVTTTTSPVSDLPTPPRNSVFFFLVTLLWKWSLVPIFVHLSPFFLPIPPLVPYTSTPVSTAKPITSVYVPSTITAKASANLTSQFTLHPDVINVDSPMLSCSDILQIPVCHLSSQVYCSVEQRHPALSSTGPAALKDSCSNPKHAIWPQLTPHPTLGTPDSQQKRTSLPSTLVSTRILQLRSSGRQHLYKLQVLLRTVL